MTLFVHLELNSVINLITSTARKLTSGKLRAISLPPPQIQEIIAVTDERGTASLWYCQITKLTFIVKFLFPYALCHCSLQVYPYMFPSAISPCLSTQLSMVLEVLAGFPSFGGMGTILGICFSSICKGTPDCQKFPLLLCHQCDLGILCLLLVSLVQIPQTLWEWNYPSSGTQWHWKV